MFCKNCGSEIRDDVNFCPHCGYGKNTQDSAKGFEVDVSKLFQKLQSFLEKLDFSKLLKLSAVFVTAINILIRFCSNKIVTEYSLLAQDDYIVVSDSGKVWIWIITVLYALLCAGLVYWRKKKELSVERNAVIAVIAAVAVSVIAVVLRLPAPY